VLLATLAYVFREPIRQEIIPAWGSFFVGIFEKSVCEEPIQYTISRFDNRFNISEESFLNAIKKAEASWEVPYGKELFVHVSQGRPRDLKINLIYDYRQEATTRLDNIGGELKDNRESYDQLRKIFDDLRLSYEEDKAVFDQEIKAFNQKKGAYEARVRNFNRQGGAGVEQYSQLEKDRLGLEAQWQGLEKVQSDLNKQADEVNSLVRSINRLAGILNLSVEKYNDVNTARGETFDEGVYSTDGWNREIDIYEFSSEDKLVRVLAHELGHALGLPHVEDRKAIMYSYNEGSSTEVTATDLSLLDNICKGS